MFKLNKKRIIRFWVKGMRCGLYDGSADLYS